MRASVERLALSAVLLLAVRALGHGAPPQSTSVALSADGGLALVGTTFGAVVTRDDGAAFRWVCEEAIGLSQGERAAWHLSEGGAWFAGAFSGLYVSRDRGCSFAPHPDFAATGVTALAGQGGALYVASGRYGVTNGLWRSTDDGRTFTATPAQAAATFFSSVVLAPSRPQRVYLGGWYFEPPASTAWVSDDGATSFTAVDLTPGLPAAGPFTVLAVHPQSPDVVLAALSSSEAPVRHWLLRSADAARTFSVALELAAPATSAAFAQDGHLAWVAAGDALYESQDEGATFVKAASPQRKACVFTAGGRRWSCGEPANDGFSVAAGPEEGPLTPWLTWERIIGVAECPLGSPVRTTCDPFYPVLRAELGLAPMTLAPEPAPPAGCGCLGAPGALGLAALVSFFRTLRPRRRVRPIG